MGLNPSGQGEGEAVQVSAEPVLPLPLLTGPLIWPRDPGAPRT